MIPMIRVQTGAGASAPAVFNHFISPFNVGIGCVITGTVNYTIQHTFDDVMGLGVAACTWFPHDDAGLVAATANANGNFAFPCTASRILVNSGSGTVTTTYIQAGVVG